MSADSLNNRVALWCFCGIALTCLTGCPVVDNLPAPGRLLQNREPETDRRYCLYIPTYYKPDRRWPLVVACHGTVPFDTRSRELDEWDGLAEQKGFLLAAPELTGTATRISSTPEQIRRQLDDERAILSMVRSIRAAWNVDDTQVFLFGWSAGAYAVLFTGLRNPDIFRALSIRQGNFNADYLNLCPPFLDRFQPIQLVYTNYDPIDDTQFCAEWLRSHDLDPTLLERSGIHRRIPPETIYAFFAGVVKDHPMIRIRVREDPADPMRVALSFKASFEPQQCLWDFGDANRSEEAAPEHRYETPGRYTVRLALWQTKNRPRVRSVVLQVPRVHLGAPVTTAPAGN